MKKIILISLCTPTPYNVRAGSATPYHLMKGAEGKAQFEVFNFNINNVDAEGIAKTERELGVKIHLLARPSWQKWMFRLHISPLRAFLRKPILAYYKLPRDVVGKINASDADVVWIYGEELAQWTRYFSGKKCIVTMPDCESMYYHRLLSKRFATRSLWQVLRYAIAYCQYRTMEREDWQKGATYHFLGKADAQFYKEINPEADALFLSHQLPCDEHCRTTQIKFHQPKIRLLVTGRYDLYSREACDETFAAMTSHENAIVLSQLYEVTFQGKDWDAWHERFLAAGYGCHRVGFVEDYFAELQRHDVALYPISVGTGTKGKVLDALANGLLVVGTPFALENINDWNENPPATLYHKAEVCVKILKDIAGDVEKYERMAADVRQKVLEVHRREGIAVELFEL